MNRDHQEKPFENYIVEQLQEQGWLVGTSAHYNKEYALYPDDIATWLQSTQPQKWEKIVKNNSDPMAAVMKRLASCLESDGKASLTNSGTISILRRGFTFVGCGQIAMSESAPEDLRNEDVVKRYEANILRVVPQLKYNPVHKYAIDLVFFINGLPVATVEVKTDFTQSINHAVEQYRNDRLPYDKETRRKEPLLSFKRGAVVHFAMSETDIQMTTRLNGLDTFFLPFNQGNNGHAGNANRTDGDYPVAYFWRDVCQRDAWLRIFHSFVYVEKKDVVDLQGNWKRKETLIFPRYHQWAAVNAMISDARTHGAGMRYLCEHSAGSGKTSTIAWTAHDLIKLRRDNGEAIFHSVIIVTDRTVLDSQLQNAVSQIDHQIGVIATIGHESSSKSKSKQLAEALNGAVPIIVVTIQTFPYAMEAIVTEGNLQGKNFAVIIDEAHNSQTGSTASKLNAALTLNATGKLTVEELLETMQQARVLPQNISHFAFTATPKHSTFMLFGHTKNGQAASKDNLPQAFHRYPMRQAIEEGFILDVLKGYVPYKTAYNLKKQIEDKKRVQGKTAKRALAQWMTLHPTNVTQKVTFILEHFTKNVAPLLDGKAKAMIVTNSRPAAVRYKLAFDALKAKDPNYASIHALVAFSGKVTGSQAMHLEDTDHGKGAFAISEDTEFTEINMNPDGMGNDLRVTFDRPEYRVMLVANKFQTGFDQPKLVAMYIDKKIGNDIEIVQTFSRLNRTAPGKESTFIIDFANHPDNVKRAFSIFDDGATIEEMQDMHVIYDTKDFLDEFCFYNIDDLEKFKHVRFESIRALSHVQSKQEESARHKALFTCVERPTTIYNEKLRTLYAAIAQWEKAYELAKMQGNKEGMESADHQRKEYAKNLASLMKFKEGLAKFCRTYTYLAQLVDFGDTSLENFAAFAKLLYQRLKGTPRETIDLAGIVLVGFDIKANAQGGDEEDGDGKAVPTLKPIGSINGSGEGDDVGYLHDIIARLNTLFGDVTPIEDQVAFINHIASITKENNVVMAQIEHNSREAVFKANFPGAVTGSVVRALASHNALASHVLNVDQQAMSILANLVYDVITSKRFIEIA